MFVNKSLTSSFAMALMLGSGACGRIANVNLTLVEPCNQRNQALNGVQTYQVSVTGTDLGEGAVNTFTSARGEPLLRVGQLVEDAVISVRAWEGDAESDAAILNEAPKSVGRTPPLRIDERTSDMNLVVTMGKRDSVGQTTAADGSCQSMDNGAAIPGRHGHTATFVPALNKVLIVGGAVFAEDPQTGARGETYLKSVELFDPTTGKFEPLPEMPTTRAYHTATALPDGRVLVVGGFGIIGGVVSTLTAGLLYDPSRPEEPYVTVPFWQQRALHTATLLADRQLVAIIGGCDGAGCRPNGIQANGTGAGSDPTDLLYTVEVFDIANNAVVPQANLLETPRVLHAASALEELGLVVLSGGVRTTGPVCTVEVLQAAGAELVARGEVGQATFTACPMRHTQVSLGRDRIAFIGGQTQAAGGIPQGVGSTQVVFWNTTIGIEALQASMLTGRAGHVSTLLDNEQILVLGGSISAQGATAERLVARGSSYEAEALDGPPLSTARERMAIATLPNGQIFVSGGHDSTLETSETAEIYFGE